MSDVERERLVALVSQVRRPGSVGRISGETAEAVIDALSSAGVLGGVPGEKVTVDRGAAEGVLWLAENYARRRFRVDGKHAAAVRSLRAALGGDGGTRPKEPDAPADDLGRLAAEHTRECMAYRSFGDMACDCGGTRPKGTQ